MARSEIYMHFGLLDEVPKEVERQQILAFIRTLQHHPTTPGDYVDQDATLREREVKIVAIGVKDRNRLLVGGEEVTL